MSDERISDLRRRTIADMTVRTFSDKTQHDYTHRVAISNGRLIKADATNVTFKVKNYRVEGPARYTTMTLDTSEFIRRFLIHFLPKGFHRIRHYGIFAGGTKSERLATARRLLGAPAANISADIDSADDVTNATQRSVHQLCGATASITL